MLESIRNASSCNAFDVNGNDIEEAKLMHFVLSLCDALLSVVLHHFTM